MCVMQTSADDGHVIPTVPDLVAASEALTILRLKSRTSLQMLVLTGKLTPATTTPLGNLFLRTDVERLAAERAGAAS